MKDDAPRADEHAPPGPNDVASVVQERDEYLNGWKRALADYENFKREAASRMSEFEQRKKIEVIRDILPLIDTLEQALSHIPDTDRAAAWYQGLTHTQKQWSSFLKQQGVTKLDCVGQTFDPAYHEAIQTAHVTDAKDHTIVSVLSNGYILDTELIRPAQVTVNKLT